MRLRHIVWLLSAVHFQHASAGQLYTDFPESIDTDERYVIYSHGLIVEGNNPRPEHPENGIYDFPAIKNALFGDGSFSLIAHHRPRDTDIVAYVAILEDWVKQLLDAGVPASRITLVGFSRGGHLSAYAASRLRDTGISTALMGACFNGDIAGLEQPLLMGGHLLSIYETTDSVQSCRGLADRSHLLSFEERAITTGRKHGAFFQPLPEWIEPLQDWIARINY